ncbi:MAG: hypothetical protein ACE5FC_05485 [Myxococcota bacterium]
MLDPDASKTALKNLFRRSPIAQLGALYRALKTRARRSVIRRLKSIGYFSSYTHAGGYYTLRDIPSFDRFGLWHYGNVGFCRTGTLKATVKELVEKSEDGRTHQELQALLRVPVHNTLLDHVRAARIERKPLDHREGVYLSANPSRAAKQWRRRQAQRQRIGEPHGPQSIAVTIEVLVEALHAGNVQVSPQQIVRRLAQRKVVVPLRQAQAIFDRYGLGKKGGPDSPRSRRSRRS